MNVIQIQEIIDKFEFSKSRNIMAAELCRIFQRLDIRVKPLNYGVEEERPAIVLESLESVNGITPKEFKEFMGYDYIEHEWRYADGMLCGVDVINGVLHRIVDFGGFNSKPATFRVNAIARKSDNIINMPINPNGYSLDNEVRRNVENQLQKMGVI